MQRFIWRVSAPEYITTDSAVAHILGKLFTTNPNFVRDNLVTSMGAGDLGVLTVEFGDTHRRPGQACSPCFV